MDTNLIQNAMHNQPVICISTAGGVGNGKSSSVKSLTGITTQKFASEKKSNVTVKLGYANAKFYKCSKCEPPSCYQTGNSNEFSKECDLCSSEMTLVNHVSFLDCPGHIKFMATMIGGKCVMDGSIMIEAINSHQLPATQTIEHMNALAMGNIPIEIICLNKCDLVSKETTLNNINVLKTAFKGTILENAMYIPTSATFDINIDILCQKIAEIPVPNRDLNSSIKMFIVRSFNVNKPGTVISELKGGVVGGSITRGVLKVGDIVKLLPGFVKKSDKKKVRYIATPLKARVLSISSEENKLEYAITGGLIGVQLDIDPALTTSDGLVGNLLTAFTSTDVDVFEELALKYKLIDNNSILSVDDKIQININANNTDGTITKIIPEEQAVIIKLEYPIAASIGDIATICNNSSIFGSGIILEGLKSKLC